MLVSARCLMVWLLVVIVWLPSTLVCAQTEFSNLFIFGDSLSDTGNLSETLGVNLPPPYFQNRISNGPVAADLLAASLGFNADAAAAGGNNYAILGGNILGNDFGDLSSQVSRFLADQPSELDSQALYVVFMGGNDLRDLRGQVDAGLASNEIDLILAALEAELQRLIARGARLFLIPNVPDIGRIPQTIELEVSNPGIAERASDYVALYNQRLVSLSATLSAAGNQRLVMFDAFAELNRILDNPAAFGFSVTDVGCFDPQDSINPFDFEFDAGCDNPLFPLFPPDFTGYVFFDSIHPTTATYNLVGNAIIDRLAEFDAEPETSNFTIAPIVDLILND